MSTTARYKGVGIVLASGSGTRFRSETPKQFLKLAGKTVLEHTLDVFELHPGIGEIVVVVAAENRLMVEELVTRGNYSKVKALVVALGMGAHLPTKPVKAHAEFFICWSSDARTDVRQTGPRAGRLPRCPSL